MQQIKCRQYCRILSVWNISEGVSHIQQETIWKKESLRIQQDHRYSDFNCHHMSETEPKNVK
jgi:hypothetical protein